MLKWEARYEKEAPLIEGASSFYDITKEGLQSFGYKRPGAYLGFDCKNGVFSLLGHLFPVFFVTESGERIGFNPERYDLIQFKTAEMMVGSKASQIVQFNIGYKTVCEGYRFQVICEIPNGRTMRFRVRIVAPQDVTGKLVIGVAEIPVRLSGERAFEHIQEVK